MSGKNNAVLIPVVSHHNLRHNDQALDLPCLITPPSSSVAADEPATRGAHARALTNALRDVSRAKGAVAEAEAGAEAARAAAAAAVADAAAQKARADDLEARLGKYEALVAELEQSLASRDTEVETLKNQVEQLTNELNIQKDANQVSDYSNLMNHPMIPQNSYQSIVGAFSQLRQTLDSSSSQIDGQLTQITSKLSHLTSSAHSAAECFSSAFNSVVGCASQRIRQANQLADKARAETAAAAAAAAALHAQVRITEQRCTVLQSERSNLLKTLDARLSYEYALKTAPESYVRPPPDATPEERDAHQSAAIGFLAVQLALVAGDTFSLASLSGPSHAAPTRAYKRFSIAASKASGALIQFCDVQDLLAPRRRSTCVADDARMFRRLLEAVVADNAALWADNRQLAHQAVVANECAARHAENAQTANQRLAEISEGWMSTLDREHNRSFSVTPILF